MYSFICLMRSLHINRLQKISSTTHCTSALITNCATLNEFQLPYLNKEESLAIFLKKALRNCNPSVHCPDELMDLAKQLAERCHGLPLALDTLGSLLSKIPATYSEWFRVAQKLDWHVDGKECMNVLALSYNELSYDLKSCFHYLANFPKDFIIIAKSLTKMWIAEGFVSNKRGVMEDNADDCLEELAQRNLIQVHSRYMNGRIKTIMLHDLLRDLAIQEAQESDFLLIFKKDGSLSGTLDAPRRVVLDDTVEHNRCEKHNTLEKHKGLEKINISDIRSFIQFGGVLQRGLRFLLLRVLELRNAHVGKVPIELKNMIHLRYLGMYDTVMYKIPEIIGCLQNLQTLDLRGTYIESLPDSLWNIPALRYARGPREPFFAPPTSANLVNLQTLKQFVVPMSWKRGLPHLPNLRRLALSLCDSYAQADKYEDREWALLWELVTNLLRNLKDLISLELGGHYLPVVVFDARTSPSYQKLKTLKLLGFGSTRISLGDVQMPPNLVKLILNGIHFEQDPMPTLEKLRCLQVLLMSGIEGFSKMVCSAKEFPQLVKFQILRNFSLKEWIVEEEAMPMLKSLVIVNCIKVQVLPGLQHVTSLKELHLDAMSNELVSRIQDSGEDRYKINHVPLITIISFF